MEWIFDIIPLLICITIYIKIKYDINKLKEQNEAKDKQIQHLWTKIGQLEKKIKNNPE